MFLTLMVIGLVGLIALAIPAFAHGHALSGQSGTGHGGIGHGVGHAQAAPQPGARDVAILPADPHHQSALRFLPSPRAVFSVLAVYGAFGNAAAHAFHLTTTVAAFAVILPTLLVEWLLVRPIFRLVFRFQADASSPLESLVLNEAEAVVPFRNGRGMVSTVRDGRRVQLAARLCDDQQSLPVNVGDRLVIESVDASRERVTVSIV
jgi:hypothetical protein